MVSPGYEHVKVTGLPVLTVPLMLSASHHEPQLNVQPEFALTSSSTARLAALKVAVTVVAVVNVNVHVAAVPVHAPDHETKIMSVSGDAVSVTLDPTAYVWVQVVPHAMSEPLDTVPLPLPAFATVSATAGRVANAASTETSALMVKVHVGDVPVHAPLHELNEEIAFGLAVSVTLVPGA
jgi:hypothetical protein